MIFLHPLLAGDSPTITIELYVPTDTVLQVLNFSTLFPHLLQSFIVNKHQLNNSLIIDLLFSSIFLHLLNIISSSISSLSIFSS